MATQLPPRPVVPTPPASVAAEMAEDKALWDDVNAAFKAGLNGDYAALDGAADRLRVGLLHRPVRNEQQRTDRDRWESAVRRYNEQAKAYNAALKARKQERRNAAQVAAVRAAACPRCFATHPGEC